LTTPQKQEAISDRKVDYNQVLNPRSGQEEAILHQPGFGHWGFYRLGEKSIGKDLAQLVT
jgi:hypothetical protein